jgi:hypothetical protein
MMVSVNVGFLNMAVFMLVGVLCMDMSGQLSTPRGMYRTLLHTDLQIPTVKAEITNLSIKYQEKLTTHPNELTGAIGRRRAKKIKTLQTNRTNNKILIGTARRYESIWGYSVGYYSTSHALTV